MIVRQFAMVRSAVAVTIATLSLSAAAYAADGSVFIGKVLHVEAKAHTFTVQLSTVARPRLVATSAKTVYLFNDGKKASFADIKAGKVVAVASRERIKDAYLATGVTIRR